MTAQELLARISDYCRQTGLAESTFGRRAVNDGKLANRLRNGGRITTETVDRIQAFMDANRGIGLVRNSARPEPGAAPAGGGLGAAPGWESGALPRPAAIPGTAVIASSSPRVSISTPAPQPALSDPRRNFRFVDNREKYLLFVNTCSEKWVIASRVALELANVHPRPPALRVFDAGVGDGTVLLRVLRAMHDRFPHTPFYAVGKEIRLED